MKLKTIAAAVLFATSSLGAWALTVTEYNTAGFTYVEPGKYTIDGFGRGSSNNLAPRPQTTPQDAPALVPFFDTWNLDTRDIAPGQYSFSSLVIDATGGLVFNSVSFSSYDASGHRNTVLFDLNASGTQAVGSGMFTVLASCPVASCVWIDISGAQPANTIGAGYGGTTVVSSVPEPAPYAMLALGLTAFGLARRRARNQA